MVTGFSEVRRSVSVCPAALNARSLAALEACTLRILLAETANKVHIGMNEMRVHENEMSMR